MHALAYIHRHGKLALYTSMIVVTTVMLPATIPLYYRAAFLGYAFAVFAILAEAEHSRHDVLRPTARTRAARLIVLILGLSGIIILTWSRLYLFARYGTAPLGYDTGIYLQYVEALARDRTLFYSTISSGHLAYASWLPYHLLTNFEPLTVLHLTHILHQFLLAGALFFFVASIAEGPRRLAAAAIAVFLFSISLNQFLAYWWIFFKQSMALPFILFALGLAFRRSWLAVPIGAFAVAIHPQSIIPVALAYGVYVAGRVLNDLFRRRTLGRVTTILILGGVITTSLIVVLKGRELGLYLEHVRLLRGFATNAPSWQVAQNQGLFIPIAVSQTYALFYLPFAYLGLLSMRRRPLDAGTRSQFIATLLIVLLMVTIFPVIYQHRFLILFDLLLIALAAIPLIALVIRSWNDRIGQAVVVVLIAGMMLIQWLSVTRFEPQVFPDELDMIRNLPAYVAATPGALLMTTSALYTPWVNGFTHLPVIAPGSGDTDRWTLNDWSIFWGTKDDERRVTLLARYGTRPIIMFVGRRQAIGSGLEKFLNEHRAMTRVGPQVWRYEPEPDAS